MAKETVVAPAVFEADFVVRCHDDSMNASGLLPGDLVFIKACSDVENGKLAAVELFGTVVLRKLYRRKRWWSICADNPGFASLLALPDDDDFKILGAAVGICRAL